MMHVLEPGYTCLNRLTSGRFRYLQFLEVPCYQNRPALFNIYMYHELKTVRTVSPTVIETLPDWETARHFVFPLLEPVYSSNRSMPDVSASALFDPLSAMLTSVIKTTLALFYQGAIIPLSEGILRDWAITVSAVQLAMEYNLAVLASTSRFELHRRERLQYWSLHTAAAPFNSVLPFHAPFRARIAELLGMPFYFAVPDRKTVILFSRESLPLYPGELRRDILLERDCSTCPLSSELLEVSSSGVLAISR